jgi:DUF2971 family protein
VKPALCALEGRNMAGSSPVPQPKTQFAVHLYADTSAAWITEFPDSQQTPPPLYHYTNAAGLIGIIESRSLWASAIGHSNDLREIACAYEIAAPIVNELLEHSEFQTSNQKNLLRFLQTFFASPERPMQDGYAVSFCVRGDLLSQWRAYGDQGGFSVEFDPVTRFDPLQGQTVSFRSNAGHKIILRQIDYDPDSHRIVLRTRLEQVLRFVYRLTDGQENPEITSLVNSLFTWWLVEWVYSVKDAAFEEEQEWRLICFPNINWVEGAFVFTHYDTVKSRIRNGEIVPYVVVEPTQTLLPIKSVNCGPHPHPSLTQRAVELALKSSGYTCPVNQSRVPLRTSR